jgi:Polyketide cyclase / dehydrase and lipid transport
MKIALAILGLIVLLVILVIAIGSMLPKAHTISRSAHYSASPEQLFALIAGPQNWRPDVLESSEFTEADGRRFQKETTRDKTTMTYELLGIDAPRSIQRRIATQNLPFGGTWTFSLQPSDAGTTVRITEAGEVYNPFFRFVSRFILGYTRTLDGYLSALGKATGQEIQPTD